MSFNFNASENLKYSYQQFCRQDAERREHDRHLLAKLKTFESRTAELSTETRSAQQMKSQYEKLMMQQNPLLWSRVQQSVAVDPYDYDLKFSSLTVEQLPREFSSASDQDSLHEGVWPHSPSPFPDLAKNPTNLNSLPPYKQPHPKVGNNSCEASGGENDKFPIPLDSSPITFKFSPKCVSSPYATKKEDKKDESGFPTIITNHVGNYGSTDSKQVKLQESALHKEVKEHSESSTALPYHLHSAAEEEHQKDATSFATINSNRVEKVGLTDLTEARPRESAFSKETQEHSPLPSSLPTEKEDQKEMSSFPAINTNQVEDARSMNSTQVKLEECTVNRELEKHSPIPSLIPHPATIETQPFRLDSDSESAVDVISGPKIAAEEDSDSFWS